MNFAGIQGKSANIDLVGEMLRRTVDMQVQNITQQLFPTRVIRQQRSSVILNFGSDRFQEGQHVQLIEKGKSAYDPDTGILLYQDELPRGTAVVYEINDRIAKAYIEKYKGDELDVSAVEVSPILKKGVPVVLKAAAIKKNLQKSLNQGNNI